MTHEDFLNRLKKVNSFYSDNKFIIIGRYIDMKSKILVRNKYGDYLIQPIVLLKGFNISIKSAIDKTKHWILRAKEVHGEVYDYSRINYITDYISLNIICRVHGEFNIRGSAHLSGQGCKKCYVKNLTSSKNIFIEKANIKHNNTFDYSLVNYVNNKINIKIICK